MTTYTQRFEELKAKASRRVTCPGCGKRRTVTRTFTQTVNPWHPAVKALPPEARYDAAWHAVRQSVNDEAKAWVPSVWESRHVACVEGGVA